MSPFPCGFFFSAPSSFHSIRRVSPARSETFFSLFCPPRWRHGDWMSWWISEVSSNNGLWLPMATAQSDLRILKQFTRFWILGGDWNQWLIVFVMSGSICRRLKHTSNRERSGVINVDIKFIVIWRKQFSSLSELSISYSIALLTVNLWRYWNRWFLWLT